MRRDVVTGEGRRGRALAGASLAVMLCAMSGAADAETRVERQLGDGSSISLGLPEGIAVPRLDLDVPPVATWTATGFAEPLEIQLSANYIAFIDRWRLSVYRAGDVARLRPLAMFEGGPSELPAQVAWEGRPESGPKIRPGETLHVELAVRDVAGNLDRSAAQSVLVSRYLMPRETDAYADERRARAARFGSGIAYQQQAIPVSGRAVDMAVAGWQGEASPALSGLVLDAGAREGRSQQILPPGRYSLVAQRLERRYGGARVIPMTGLDIEVPPGGPVRVQVKGSGTLERLDAVAALPAPAGLSDDGAVTGADALSLMPLEDDAVARLTLAVLDPEAPVTLYADARRRRFLAEGATAATALWGGPNAPMQPPSRLQPPSLRTVETRFPARMVPELTLPHTDILPGSLRIELTEHGLPIRGLSAGRDYFTEFAEGRVLLTAGAEAVMTDLRAQGRDARLRVSYSIVRVPGRADPAALGGTFDIADDGASLSVSNAEAAGVVAVLVDPAPPPPQGLLDRMTAFLKTLFN